MRRFLREADADRVAGDVAARREPRVHPREQRLIDRLQGRRLRNRHQRLPAERFAARLHAAFVVAFAGPAEARLHQVMRRERRKPRRQRALAADEDPDDGRAEIVVRDPAGHAIEMREGPHVPIEKTDLVLALVDPGKVAAGVHQPHQKEPRLATGAVEIDEHLEEVDLGEIPGPIRQRHEHLATLALPLGDRLFDERDADPMALGDQQLVEPRGGQLLFPAGPLRRLGQQRRPPARSPRPRPVGRGAASFRIGSRFLEVLADRHPRKSQLPGHVPLRSAFHQHFMPNDMHLIHPEHPFQRTPDALDPASSQSGPQVVYFPSGEWSTF